MEDAMVTGRMSDIKKKRGNGVLERFGMNASQAINLLYDRLAKEQDVRFLSDDAPTRTQWENAALLVDSIVAPEPVYSRFDDMTRGEIALEQARARGLV